MDLRLLSENIAVHSDMLTWNREETPEDAALQILNVLFGVIRFSMKIEAMSEEHKKMAAFWIDFAIKNKEVLLESKLIPYEPQYLYPVIKAQSEKEVIIGVYARTKVVEIETGFDGIKLFNATKEDRLYLLFFNSNKKGKNHVFGS